MASDSTPRSRLPGLEHFHQHLRALLAARSSTFLLLIDIEGMDFILRTFGPEKRAELTHVVGQRLLQALGQGMLPFRITQDCYAVPLPDCSHERALELADAAVRAITSSPVKIKGVACLLYARAGLSHYPSQVADSDELVRTAAYASHRARRQQRPVAVYDHYSDERERERFRLMVDLEQALHAQRDLHLLYQPIVTLDEGRPTSVEALCRWRHHELGPLAPRDFLPYIEQSALILPLTETVLGLGLADLRQWRDEGLDLQLNINLSPGLFRQPALLKRLLEQFRFAGAHPEQVQFEVAGRPSLTATPHAAKALSLLHDWGCSLALDDFGARHCSLAALGSLPLEALKIDTQVIRHLDQAWSQAVVSAAVVIATRLGLRTVAEGIETQEQYQLCRDLGVQLGQGFHIARPMTRKQVGRWLGERDLGGMRAEGRPPQAGEAAQSRKGQGDTPPSQRH